MVDLIRGQDLEDRVSCTEGWIYFHVVSHVQGRGKRVRTLTRILTSSPFLFP